MAKEIEAGQPVCEHCGAPWMTDSQLYNDGCCTKDQMAQDRRECPEGEE